ncbi:hypothetical protein GGI25_004262 [Coemansia spiralis]|uniref:Rhodanese domain-containing protein n=2 Tax=Coemansia TaxID=4863 RepID=A0A9W8G6X7_9FUNG|nr:Rhodanese-like domain-containing protein [Coemansia spiralis]KAJ1990495.1 hypothetical protein EDC05_004036 [Coemansia umbellata]KAJ2620801.1 hypothetical protein GGI26_004697 [Coemansia sp. RSA 1358]KAJ2674611.1 hypothetical protein GGI25_004262 [Coemansia spiralis]
MFRLVRPSFATRRAPLLARAYSVKSDVSYEELRQLIHGVGARPYALIDVREPNEIAEGKVPTAVNIPLGDVAAAFALPSNDFKAKFGIDRPSEDDDTIFYCRSGKRSQNAVDQVEKVDPSLSIRNYRGSWLNYSENALGNKSLK